jgi:regulator of replication initiation timing
MRLLWPLQLGTNSFVNSHVSSSVFEEARQLFEQREYNEAALRYEEGFHFPHNACGSVDNRSQECGPQHQARWHHNLEQAVRFIRALRLSGNYTGGLKTLASIIANHRRIQPSTEQPQWQRVQSSLLLEQGMLHACNNDFAAAISAHERCLPCSLSWLWIELLAFVVGPCRLHWSSWKDKVG